MKQHEHKIDELFDKAFENYKVEPSEQIWENIRKQIPQGTNIVSPGKKSLFNKFTYFIFSAALVVIICSVVYFLPLFNPEPAKKITQVNSYTDDHKQINKSKTDNQFTENTKINTDNKNNSSKENNLNQNSANINKIIDHTQNTPTGRQQNKIPTEPVVMSKTSGNNITGKPNKTEESLAVTKKLNNENIISNAVNKQVTNNTNYTVPIGTDAPKTEEINIQHTKINQAETKPADISKIKTLNVKYIPIYNIRTINTFYASEYQIKNNLPHARPRIYIGIHYTPEWMYNMPEIDSVVKPKNSNFNQSAQISANYDYKNITIQSGIGLSFYNNEALSSVNYISCDSVGYYEKVTSFYVIMESGTPNVVFNTVPVNVYDSLYHSSYEFTRNNYRYLQIPLLIGYKMYYNRFSLTIRSGAGLGILNYKKEPGTPFNKKDAQLLSIEQHTPSLTKTYWQFLFSVGGGYQFTDNISIAVEPTFKYYLSPFYEQKDFKRYPYSIGVKTGIYFRF